MPQATQVNTRMSSDLKQQAEAAFAAAGLTSSQAIRMLYRFASEHRHQPELIAQQLAILDDEDERAMREKRERGLAAIKRGHSLFYDTLAKLDIRDPDRTILDMPFDQLKELAFSEKYGMDLDHGE